MLKTKRWMIVGLLAAMLPFMGACGYGPKEDPFKAYMETVPTRQLDADRARGLRDGDAVVPLLSDGQQYYVPMREVAMIAGYVLKRDGVSRSYRIGRHDPVMEIRLDSREAVKHDETVQLPQQPIELSGSLHMPLDSFERLFADELRYTVQGSRMMIHSNETGQPSVQSRQSNWEFRDERQGASDGQIIGERGAGHGSSESGIGHMRAASVDNDAIITEARKYLGVRYEFGTGPYSASNKRFDCSTFTRHVFAKQGIELPRTARAQGKLGTEVGRSSLRKGDLLFFSVPGRFERDNIIGHVGIYMGNGKMIHASPEPKDGVQITDINTPYWKNKFITAKRMR